MPVVDTIYRLNNTDGVTCSTGNTGASLLSANGGTITFEADAADEGATGIQFVSSAGLIEYGKFPLAGSSAVGGSGVGEWTIWDIPFWTPAVAPNVDSSILILTNAAGGTGTTCLRLLYAATTGNVYLLGKAGSAAKSLISGAPLNTKYYFTGYARIDTATTGNFTAKCLTAARGAVGSEPTDAAYNLGTGALDEVRLGVLTVLTASTTHKYDTVRLQSGVTGSPAYMGAYSPPAANPPTVAAIAAQQKTTGEAFSFTAVATDTSGTIDHYTWRLVSGASTITPSTTATQAGTAHASTPGTNVYGVIAVSTTGLSSAEVFATLYVNAATGVAADPVAVRANPGGWGYGGTATDLLDGLSGAGEWALTAAGPASAELDITGPPMPSTAATVTFKAVLKATDGTTLAAVGQTGTILAQFYSGNTAISQPVNVVVDRTSQTVTIALTSQENTAFTAAGRADPNLRVFASAA